MRTDTELLNMDPRAQQTYGIMGYVITRSQHTLNSDPALTSLVSGLNEKLQAAVVGTDLWAPYSQVSDEQYQQCGRIVYSIASYPGLS